MRKVTYGGACSLDGFITGANGDISWIRWGDEAAAFMKHYWATIDTLVMGRMTYEFAKSQGRGDSSSFPGVGCYVCSRTLPVGRDGATEIVKDGVALVKSLKAQPGKDICIFGGGNLAASLLDAKLIDEVGFNVHPVLLGDGVPLVGKLKRHADLELVKSETWKNGCLLVTYRVKR
jgi:dihydrofolate reductase